jgi:anaerobic selenocysteine-containing dehydrogenase
LSSPDQAEFYTSGRASNEAAYLYQLFVRAYGTNNFPTARTCATRPAAWRWRRALASAKAP